MIKLTDELDNFVVLNPTEIAFFRICVLKQRDNNLGMEIILKSGTTLKVQECLSDIRTKLMKVGVQIV